MAHLTHYTFSSHYNTMQYNIKICKQFFFKFCSFEFIFFLYIKHSHHTQINKGLALIAQNTPTLCKWIIFVWEQIIYCCSSSFWCCRCSCSCNFWRSWSSAWSRRSCRSWSRCCISYSFVICWCRSSTCVTVNPFNKARDS